ncbi:thioredoxin [Nocardia donostiensis]|uniref:TlpA family protein disulfide reductase n=1 Tax=Nocardia donostiensis TaxID=1538463 RepID=UPI0009F0A564|nr:TlpA disulfide reductase family protein [Nocardia donostiensis]OQS14338.1 thioredoxin [Nocardia donostiensis]
MSRVPVAWRWLLAGVIVVVAAAVALWPRDGGGEQTADRAPAATEIGPELRAASGAAQCPRPVDTAEGHGPLAGLSLGCLADGRPVDPAAALAGRPAVLNLWAYWCEPCRTELPILAEYAARAGSAVAVVTVHSDPGEAKALSMLAALNRQLRAEGAPELRLPGFQDPDARVRAAAGAPNALPITVLVRADGTIADYVARPFHDVDDIASIVADKLGVTV